MQPSARLLWTPSAAQTVVLSATRAVRTPSRVERDYTTGSLLNAAVPMFARLEPNPAFETEHLRGYEASYRVRPASQIFLTAGAFFNHHQDVLSTAVGTPFAETSVGPPRLIVPVQFGNDLHGNSHGVEVTADMRPTRWWRWTASYSGLRVQLTRDPGGIDGSQENRGEGGSPNHQAQVHSSVDLPGNVEMDWHFRYVSRLRAFAVPAYATSRPEGRVAPLTPVHVGGGRARTCTAPPTSSSPGGAATSAYVAAPTHGSSGAREAG